MSGNSFKELHLENKLEISSTLLVFHFEISGKESKLEQPEKYNSFLKYYLFSI